MSSENSISENFTKVYEAILATAQGNSALAFFSGDNSVRFFFPEFEEIILNSRKENCLNPKLLKKNLEQLYFKKIGRKEPGYFLGLRKILESEKGKLYLLKILNKK